MKKRSRYILITLCVLLLTGCGHVKSAKKLIRRARADHGACKVISQTETEEKTEVVLQDKLQGFTYTVKSYMYDISIDGSSFGSLPQTRDNFLTALIDYALDASSDEIRALLQSHKATFERDQMLLVVDMEDDGVAVSEGLATILQKYNLENRMDGVTVFVSNKKEHLGSIRLPDCTFRDPETEQIDDYTMRAEILMQSVSKKNRSLTFVKKESVPFSELGLPLSRVSVYSAAKIEKESDPVTLYYFKTNQQTFFIANFDDAQTGAAYTNFDLSLEKEAKGEKGFIHFHIN